MINCPYCGEQTISRWRAVTTCSNCSAVVRDSYVYRLVCVPLPMTAAALAMSRWFPDARGYVFASIVAAVGVVGLAVNYAYPQLKTVHRPSATDHPVPEK